MFALTGLEDGTIPERKRMPRKSSAPLNNRKGIRGMKGCNLIGTNPPPSKKTNQLIYQKTVQNLSSKGLILLQKNKINLWCHSFCQTTDKRQVRVRESKQPFLISKVRGGWLRPCTPSVLWGCGRCRVGLVGRWQRLIGFPGRSSLHFTLRMLSTHTSSFG